MCANFGSHSFIVEYFLALKLILKLTYNAYSFSLNLEKFI